MVNLVNVSVQWLHPFEQLKIHQGKFWISREKSIDMKFMSTRTRVRHAFIDELGSTFLEFRFRNSKAALVIILPKERDGLEHVRTKIKSIELMDFVNKLEANEAKFLKKLSQLNCKLELLDLKEVGERWLKRTFRIRLPSLELEFVQDVQQLLGRTLNKTAQFSNASFGPNILNHVVFGFTEKGKCGHDIGDRWRKSSPNLETIIIDHPFMYFLHLDGQIVLVGQKTFAEFND
jgi:serine protease inhibitor